jgi:DNA-binding transcriptional MerR regulator
MPPKARVQKRLYYKIGEACKALGIQPYVLRYWETEFPPLAPSKSRSGQRVYSERELEIIKRIKELLYDEGYTIAGAKKKLETELAGGTLGAGDAPGADLELETERILATEAAAVENGDEDAEPAPPSPPAKERKRPSAATALDTNAAERLQTLRAGVQKALQEAHEILAYIDSKNA